MCESTQTNLVHDTTLNDDLHQLVHKLAHNPGQTRLFGGSFVFGFLQK